MKQIVMEFLRCTGFLKPKKHQKGLKLQVFNCPYRQKHGTKCGYHRRQK